MLFGSAMAHYRPEIICLGENDVIQDEIVNSSLEYSNHEVSGGDERRNENVVNQPVKLVRNQSKDNDNSIYHTLKIGYSPFTFEEAGMSAEITALSWGWQMGVPIMYNHPLYFEFGAGMMYGFKNVKDEYSKPVTKVNTSLLAVNVPLVATWRFKTPSVIVAPYFGLNIRANIFGQIKETEGDDEFVVNWFKPEDGYEAKRVNFGTTFGVNISYEKLFVGVGYTNDFKRFMGDVKVDYFTISLGVNF